MKCIIHTEEGKEIEEYVKVIRDKTYHIDILTGGRTLSVSKKRLIKIEIKIEDGDD